jgi:hypothetical protein
VLHEWHICVATLLLLITVIIQQLDEKECKALKETWKQVSVAGKQHVQERTESSHSMQQCGPDFGMQHTVGLVLRTLPVLPVIC